MNCAFHFPRATATSRPVPMLDRKAPHILGGIDIQVEVPRVDYDKLSSDRLVESADAIRQRVRFEGSDIVCPVQEPGLSQLRYARGGSASVL